MVKPGTAFAVFFAGLTVVTCAPGKTYSANAPLAWYPKECYQTVNDAQRDGWMRVTVNRQWSIAQEVSEGRGYVRQQVRLLCSPTDNGDRWWWRKL